MGFFPQAQVLKDFSNDVPPVDEANDAHFAGTFGADKRVGFVDLADKVGPNPSRPFAAIRTSGRKNAGLVLIKISIH